MLTACGGGSGGDTAGPDQNQGKSALDPAQFQGRWGGASAEQDPLTVVVVPDTADQASAWMLDHQALKLVKLTLHSDGSANGTAYALDQDDAEAQAKSGQVTITLTEKPPRMVLTGLNAGSVAGVTAGSDADVLAFEQSDAMRTPAVQADAAGTWHASAGDGSRVIQWTVSNSGQLTGGHSSTGCTYDGNLVAMASDNSFNAQFNQSCPGVGAEAAETTAFSGIATVNPSKDRMTVVATSADASRAVAILFGK